MDDERHNKSFTSSHRLTNKFGANFRPPRNSPSKWNQRTISAYLLFSSSLETRKDPSEISKIVLRTFLRFVIELLRAFGEFKSRHLNRIRIEENPCGFEWWLVLDKYVPQRRRTLSMQNERINNRFTSSLTRQPNLLNRDTMKSCWLVVGELAELLD